METVRRGGGGRKRLYLLREKRVGGRTVGERIGVLRRGRRGKEKG